LAEGEGGRFGEHLGILARPLRLIWAHGRGNVWCGHRRWGGRARRSEYLCRVGIGRIGRRCGRLRGRCRRHVASSKNLRELTGIFGMRGRSWRHRRRYVSGVARSGRRHGGFEIASKLARLRRLLR
jgi:hypothetical protein